MSFRFHEDDTVLLVDDLAFDDVRAGTFGVICALYSLDEPAYEVLFRTQGGEEFSSVLYDHQLDNAPASDTVLPGCAEGQLAAR